MRYFAFLLLADFCRVVRLQSPVLMHHCLGLNHALHAEIYLGRGNGELADLIRAQSEDLWPRLNLLEMKVVRHHLVELQIYRNSKGDGRQ